MNKLKVIVRAVVFALVLAAFFGFPHAWVALKVQGLLWGAVLTLILGRFFCDALCPLGIVQSFVNFLLRPRSRVRRVCTRLPSGRGQTLVRCAILAVFIACAASGAMGIATMLVPISIFGKAVTLWWPGLAVFALVLALTPFGQGRIWCNWICPFGTIFHFLSRFSLIRNKLGRGCGACRACTRSQAGKKEKDSAASEKFERREILRGIGALAVAEKLTDGGFAAVTEAETPMRTRDVLPPGAGDSHKFALKCAACQLCVANCPGKCLEPSTRLKTFGQVRLAFTKGYCLPNCTRCGAVCPEMAIEHLRPDARLNVHMGFALYDHNRCLRTTEGESCTACQRKCPVRAIHLVKDVIVVDRDACIGCGACEHVCPVRPTPAIHVEGYERQVIVRPIDETELMVELRSQLASGAAAVVARGGVIVKVLQGHGVRPILDALAADPAVFTNAVVADRVVGRAAAAVYIVGRARKVVATLVSAEAKAMLENAKVTVVADEIVPQILNRERSGICPIDAKVKDLTDVHQIVSVLSTMP